MVHVFPAVLIGGPPCAGKSVLFYQITQALRERGIPHHAIRACPDGEGNWYHEGSPDTVSHIRVKLTPWPPEFVERICEDLHHRCLPFLVDVGGCPQLSDLALFRLCSHSILLLRADKPESAQLWQQMVEKSDLYPLARLSSQKSGDSVITQLSPVLEGIMAGLERHVAKAGLDSLFGELVERIVALFNASGSHDERKTHLEQAPTALVLDLEDTLQIFTTSSISWKPEMLQPFLENLPAQTPLSVYGVGPNWLYAALAASQDPQLFYLFDPKIGWIQPARVYLGMEQSAEICVKPERRSNQDFTVLKITFPRDRIDYFQPDPLAFPPVSTEQGLVIDGRVPNWLLTALVRLYKRAGVPWIAPFYVQLNKAIIAYSRVGRYQPGDPVSVVS